MRKRWHTLVAVCLGVAAGASPCQHTPAPVADARAVKLIEFFASYDCPRPFYVDHYLKAADAHDLDYRALPVISVLESTCGKYQRNNNYWGWNSGDTRFESVTAGIDFLAERLTKAPYGHPSLRKKLRVYNPRFRYIELAQILLKEIERPARPSAPNPGL
jgi:hypothetical protein